MCKYLINAARLSRPNPSPRHGEAMLRMDGEGKAGRTYCHVPVLELSKSAGEKTWRELKRGTSHDAPTISAFRCFQPDCRCCIFHRRPRRSADARPARRSAEARRAGGRQFGLHACRRARQSGQRCRRHGGGAAGRRLRGDPGARSRQARVRREGARLRPRAERRGHRHFLLRRARPAGGGPQLPGAGRRAAAERARSRLRGRRRSTSC